MSGLLGGIFTNPMTLTGVQHAWALLPLCLSISIVYKATRCDKVRDIPLAALVLCVTIVLGMYAVGIGLWILHRIML
jgi:hypothetical protein